MRKGAAAVMLGAVAIGFIVPKLAGASASQGCDGGGLGFRAVALAASYVGTKEDGGKNRGELVDAWNEANGSPHSSNWCANFVASMVREALGDDMPAWMTKTPAVAREWIPIFQKAKRWVSVDDARRDPSLVKRGMIAIWDRSSPGRPETSWFGHIGFVSAPVDADGRFPTIEGNSGPYGDEVSADMSRLLSDGRLLGFGCIG